MRFVSISACNRVASRVDPKTAPTHSIYTSLSLATLRTRNKRGSAINEEANHHRAVHRGHKR